MTWYLAHLLCHTLDFRMKDNCQLCDSLGKSYLLRLFIMLLTLKCCSSHIFFYTQVRLSLGFYTPMCTRWVSLRVMLPCASKKWYQGPVETGVDIAFPISPMGTNHVCQYRRQKTMSHSEIQVIIFHRFHTTHFLLCEVALLQSN
jgi:hypothetical protein